MGLFGVGLYRLTGKGLLASCDDDCADALVIVVVAQSFVELLEERCAESIEGLGTVQGDCSRWSALALWFNLVLDTYSGQHQAWGSK